MQPKWSPSHTLLITVVGCALAAATYLSQEPSTAPWAAPLLGILTALTGYLGLSSGKAWGSGSGPPPGTSAILIAFVAATLTLSCLPASFPSDVLTLYACVKTEVEAGVTNVGQIALACKAPEEQLVVDALNGLLDSKSWVTEHPELVPVVARMGARPR